MTPSCLTQGGGLVVAPPSTVAKGQYQFIQGSLDDLDSLPTLNDAPSIAISDLSAGAENFGTMRARSGRNAALFRHTARAAQKYCDDFEQLLDYAQTQNSQFGGPMADSEVMKVATSVWSPRAAIDLDSMGPMCRWSSSGS
ncbi:MAG: primase C-terminal domain-containing protein [Xanthobacteraceae bacterium]